jgi:hypothetical protein
VYDDNDERERRYAGFVRNNPNYKPRLSPKPLTTRDFKAAFMAGWTAAKQAALDKEMAAAIARRDYDRPPTVII